MFAACEKPADPHTTTAARTGTRIVLAVSGIHCENCERAIKQGMMTCDGVNDVAASATNEEVVVWIDPGTDLDAVKAKIETLGFQVEQPQAESAAPPPS